MRVLSCILSTSIGKRISLNRVNSSIPSFMPLINMISSHMLPLYSFLKSFQTLNHHGQPYKRMGSVYVEECIFGYRIEGWEGTTSASIKSALTSSIKRSEPLVITATGMETLRFTSLTIAPRSALRVGSS